MPEPPLALLEPLPLLVPLLVELPPLALVPLPVLESVEPVPEELDPEPVPEPDEATELPPELAVSLDPEPLALFDVALEFEEFESEELLDALSDESLEAVLPADVVV